MSMFCYQCEQAARGTGCNVSGVCGKKPDTASLQDLIIHQAKGIGYLAHELRKEGLKDADADRFVVEALFSTVTNVNFDNIRLEQIVHCGNEVISRLKQLLLKETGKKLPQLLAFEPANSIDMLITQGELYSIVSFNSDQDIRSLEHLLLYGLKGMAAYADHALILGRTDDEIFAFIHEALAYLSSDQPSVEELVKLNLKCGEVNVRTMEILDEAHTSHFGNPQPVKVSTAWKKGPAIIVSGHDLLDFEELLKQTEGTGVNVYTHGEMLPAHGYPKLKKYEHLAGHFGTAWQNQQKEFTDVPAAFLFTTNCIQKPHENYKDQVFTTGLVGWPGVKHVERSDFSEVIEKAKELGGLQQKEGGQLMTGFAHNAVLSVADKVVDAVKSGAIKHFFLVGGCDGAKPGRNYYTEFVEKTPKDSVVLTLACGKFRFNHLDLGDVGGIPRLLDIGQCNDAYSAVKIAQALAEAFNCGINDLPLSFVLSWYEQKAVVILLSLLYLGVINIRLGPTLPPFITPNILSFLVEKFNIMPLTTAEKDLEQILNN